MSLQLSDDSDIEGHPNVDKRSLIRWKQRDIHEKRETRKVKITHLQAEIACNQVLLPRLEAFSASLTAPGNDKTPQAIFNETIDRLRKNPSKDAPPTNSPDQPTYDQMVLSLLLQVGDDAKKGDEAEIGGKLKALLDGHIRELGKRTKDLQKELDTEEKEQKKHITSEDIHDGFDNKVTILHPQ